MANIIEVIVKANDQTGGTFNKLNSSFKSLTGFSLNAAGGIAMAGMAISKAVEYTKQAIASNDKYVSSIVDMARFTGDQTDAMSRLVQVADDAFLSQEALNNAMSIGAKKGLDMSVQGIKDLADQYNSLATVQEKNKLLNDNFGRSGLAMGKLLEQGSAGITKNMEAVADNLAVTDKSVKITYDYKKSVDALNDSMDGLKYTVAQNTMPVLSALNTIMSYAIDETLKLKVNNEGILETLKLLTGVLYPLIKYYELLSSVLFKAADAINNSGDASVVAADRYDKMNSALAGTASSATFAEQQLSELDNLNKSMISTVEQFTEISKLSAEEQELATRKVILVLLEQKLAVDGLSTAETNFLLNMGVQWGIYSETAVSSMQNAMISANNLAQSVTSIPDKTVTIYVDTYYRSFGVAGQPSGDGGAPYVPPSVPPYVPPPKNRPGRASGGPVSMNTPYIVGEKGPELFVPYQGGRIVPNNALDSGLTKADLRSAFTEAMSPIMSMMMSEFAKLT